MLIIHRAFSMSSAHRTIGSSDELAIGPIIDVHVVFQFWCGGDELLAEAFLDSGADCSLLSYRWLERHFLSRSGQRRFFPPPADPLGFVHEAVHVSVGGSRLVLPRSMRIARQGVRGFPFPVEMPGSEDLLLGRDFLRENGLLLAVDGMARDAALVADAAPDHLRSRVRSTLGVDGR